jgi:hypothetical protein
MKYSEHLIKRNFFLGKHHVEFLEQETIRQNAMREPNEPKITQADIVRQIIDKAMKSKKYEVK